MTVNDLKVKTEDFEGKNIQSIGTDTVVGRAEEIKRLFDAPAQEVLAEKFNELIDFLASPEGGELICLPELAEGSGTTVAEQMAYLLEEIKNVTLGAFGFEPLRYDVSQKLTETQKTTARNNIGAVPASRTVNGKALTGNVTVTMNDISGVLTMDRGGTGGTSKATARQSLNIIGLNPITNPANDVPSSWVSYGTAAAYFNQSDCLKDQPAVNGMVLNCVYSNTVVQSFISRGSSPKLWVRAGQNSTWNSSWVDITAAEHQHNYDTTAGCMRFNTYYMEMLDSTGAQFLKGYQGYGGGSILQIVDRGLAMKLSSYGTIDVYPDEDGEGSGMFYCFYPDAFAHSEDDRVNLGKEGRRWKNIYCTNGTIQTSDRNHKENIKEIEQRYEALFDRLKPVSFEFAGEDHDRVHIGFVAQDVKEAMDEVGIGDLEFAGYCRGVKTRRETATDQATGLEYTVGEIVEKDENGEPVWLHSLRYSEFIALNTQMIQRCKEMIGELKKEIGELRRQIPEKE